MAKTTIIIDGPGYDLREFARQLRAIPPMSKHDSDRSVERFRRELARSKARTKGRG